MILYVSIHILPIASFPGLFICVLLLLVLIHFDQLQHVSSQHWLIAFLFIIIIHLMSRIIHFYPCMQYSYREFRVYDMCSIINFVNIVCPVVSPEKQHGNEDTQISKGLTQKCLYFLVDIISSPLVQRPYALYKASKGLPQCQVPCPIGSNMTKVFFLKSQFHLCYILAIFFVVQLSWIFRVQVTFTPKCSINIHTLFPWDIHIQLTYLCPLLLVTPHIILTI